VAFGNFFPVLMLKAISGILVTASSGLFLLGGGLLKLFSKELGEFGLTGRRSGGAAEVLLGLLKGLSTGDALAAVVVVDAGEEGGGLIIY
jgi:hypothetical protein